VREPVEINKGDTIVNGDGEEWIIDKQMFIILPEGSELRRTGKAPTVSAKLKELARKARSSNLHTYEDQNG
jgi:hypothetical protein